jgi:hypothetical protein
MTQLAIPIEVNPAEVARKPSMGAAIALCAELAGLEPKQIQGKLAMDKGQWSRWESGHEGVIWPKLSALMDLCGNDAPHALDAAPAWLRPAFSPKAGDRDRAR